MKSSEHKMHHLPAGWKWQDLGDCCEPQLTKGTEGSTPYLEIGDIDINSKLYVYGDKPAVKGALLAAAGDVLISRVRPTRGAITVMREDWGHVSSALSVLRPKEQLLSSFVFYFLAWNRDFLKYLGENCTGTMYPTVSKDLVHAYPIPIAPLGEQERIVSEIQKQFSRLDETVANLKRVKANLKHYKAAVLKAAVEGRLVATEAELAKNKGEPFEDAVTLLAKLLTKRTAHRAKRGSRGSPMGPNAAELPSLPTGWTWTTLDQLSHVVRGASPRPAGDPRYFGGPIPWITVGPITADETDYVREVPEGLTQEGRERSRFIEPGTLLLTNSGATLGVPKISLIGGCINDGVAALLDVEEPLKQYLVQFLRTRTASMRQINQGAAQPNLNTSIIKATPVPLPPAKEQQRIVAEVERQMSLVREIEEQVAINFERADSLRRSILDRVFFGNH